MRNVLVIQVLEGGLILQATTVRKSKRILHPAGGYSF